MNPIVLMALQEAVHVFDWEGASESEGLHTLRLLPALLASANASFVLHSKRSPPPVSNSSIAFDACRDVPCLANVHTLGSQKTKY
jgi:hypothetical protein